jgi:hypothetical protein
MEGGSGVMVLVVAAADAPRYEAGLRASGYHTSRRVLE